MQLTTRTSNHQTRPGRPAGVRTSEIRAPQWAPNGHPRDRIWYAASIIETLSDPTVVLDGALRIKTANRAFYEYFGPTRSETQGKSIFDIDSREWDCPKVRDLFGRLHRGEHSLLDVELLREIPSLGERLMRLSAQRLPTEGLDPELTILVIRDATEPRRIHESLQAACSKFERQIRELLRSNAELQQFAQIASHDLKTPLLTVLQCTQILEQRCKNKIDEEDFSNFEYIAKSVRAMTVLIADLLSYSQVSTDASEISTLTDTQAVLQTALANLRASILETEATVTHESLPRVHVRPTQLLQVLQNLIGNAIQYRNGRRPLIHISAARRKDSWVFAVCDNGIGIRPQYCDRIFEPFKRLHGSERPGSGLGLSICKDIVERHGGRIWVESKIDEGSTFYLTLPT